ncbi:polysaccharide deacetylase [Paenibacillus sp. 481]|nr:polysaccharide deacetylase [Paenibacillus sp. 481]
MAASSRRRGGRRLNPKKFIGRLVLLGLIIGLCFGVYKIGTALFADDKAVKSGEVAVTEVPVFLSAAKEKATPKEYNGMKRKVAYLTFDDGPSKFTNELLDMLKQHDIKATFYMLGQNMHTYSDAVKRMAKEGHYPGLHSMTHEYNKLYKSGGSTNFVNEFKEAQEIVNQLTGVKPTNIRAPYGSAPQIGEQFRADIAAAGFTLWDWTLDSFDWKYPNDPNRIVDIVKSGLTKDVEIILLHERKQTMEAMPAIIEYIKSQGYEFEVYNENAHFMVNFHDDKKL